MSHIKEVVSKDGYMLEVLLENDSSITLNPESRLQTVRFGMLADKEFFRQASTDSSGSYIRWVNMVKTLLNGGGY